MRKPEDDVEAEEQGMCRGDSSTAMCLQLIDAGWVHDQWIDGFLAGVCMGGTGTMAWNSGRHCSPTSLIAVFACDRLRLLARVGSHVSAS